MAVSTEFIGRAICKLTLDGKEYLGIRVSGHKRNIAGQLAESRKGHGWIVSGDRIETWDMNGLVEYNEEIFAYGPYRSGHTLLDLLTGDPEIAFAQVASFVKAVAAMKARNITLSRYLPDALLVDDEGSFLILPQTIIESLRNTQTDEERVASFECFNHPDLGEERNFSFFVGVLLYRILTGTLPFIGETSEEVHRRMREQRIQEPRLLRPEIRPEVSQTILRALTPAASFQLSEWQGFLEKWSDDGLFHEVSAEERTRIEEEAQRDKKQADATFRRRVFFQRNWKTMAIVAGIVILVGAVGSSILKNALKPRMTVGMTPQQVVSLFYTSITTMNSQALQDCVIDGAGKAQINEATNLYVISRVRQGYEGSTGFVPAQQWLAQGKPKLKPGVSVYGVADLSISQQSPGVFTVHYQKWEPVQQSSNQPPSAGIVPIQVQGTQMTDVVYLKNEGKFWAIYRIDTTKSSPVSPPITVTEPGAQVQSPAALPQ